MASIDGLQNNALIVNTLDGLTTITTAGGIVDPSLYVPYTSATGDVNIQPYSFFTTNVNASRNITGNALITLNTTGTNSYQFKINNGTKYLELYYTGAVVNYWDTFGDYYLNGQQLHFNSFAISSPDNTNFYLKYNSSNVFYIDQYGNLFANQGIYFNGNTDHYIGNIGASNIVFSLQTVQKVSFLTNNIERAYINSSGLNSNASINLYDTASSNYWSLNTDPSTFRLNIAYDSSLVGYITNGGLFNINSANITTLSSTTINTSTLTASSIVKASEFQLPSVIGSLTEGISNANSGGTIYYHYNYTNPQITYPAIALMLNTSGLGALPFNFMYRSAGSSVNNTLATLNSAGLFNSNSLSFSNTINGINTTVFNFIANLTSDCQAQINAITTSYSNFITKTGANNGINCFLNLTSTGTVNISDVSLTSLFSVGSGGGTFVKNMTSTSQINSVSASYYDPTSSIQTQLNTINSSYIAKTGTTSGCSPYIVLTSGQNFQVVDHTGTAPLFTVADTGGLVSFGQFQIQTNTIANLFASYTNFNCNSSYGYQFNYGGLNKYQFLGTNCTLQQVNNLNTKGSANFYDSTANLTCNIAGEVQSTLNPSGGGLGQFRLLASSSLNGCIFRNDGYSTYLLFTNAGDSLGPWNGLRPFYVIHSSGQLNSQNGQNFLGGLQTDTITTNAMGQLTSSLVVRTTSVAGANSAMLIGSASSTNNTGTVNWNYTSSGSTSNNLGIGVYGNDSVIQVYPGQFNINKALFYNGSKISGYNNYVLCQNAVNGVVSISDQQTISLTTNSVAWTSGYTYSSIFTKYTDGSVVSILGTCSLFVSSAGSIVIRVRFTNISSGNNYDLTVNAFFNTTGSHLCIGVSGQINNMPNGVYNVNFMVTGGSAPVYSDYNDYIKCMVLITPS
jgi:hypothetical protein